MPQITKLVAGRKNPSRVNIYCDGEFVMALSLDEVVKNQLKVSSVITDKKLQSLKDQDNQDYAYQKILNFLSYRPRTRSEIIARLKKYDIQDPTYIITRLESNKYIDDLAFSKWFIQSRTNNRPRSKRHLVVELSQKGVPREVITQALSNYQDSLSLNNLINKKLNVGRAKLTTYLIRRGFNYSEVTQKLDEIGIKE